MLYVWCEQQRLLQTQPDIDSVTFQKKSVYGCQFQILVDMVIFSINLWSINIIELEIFAIRKGELCGVYSFNN